MNYFLLQTSQRPRLKFEIIWVCETPLIILYSDVAIFPRYGGKRDVTHLIYVKIKPYQGRITFSVVLAKTAWFQTFPSTKVSDEIKFQNASKRQIKIIYFYVIKTPLYKIIAGDSQTILFRIWVCDADYFKPAIFAKVVDDKCEIAPA